MGFRRFLAWIVEKLVELNLGAVAVLLVKFLLPVTRDAYQSPDAFLSGVRDTYASASDDASFVAGNFLGNSEGAYALHAYVAALYVVGFYFYVSSLYVLFSLLAVGLGRRAYPLFALFAYVLAFGLFVFRFVHVYDDENLFAGGALFGLGAVIVLVCAVTCGGLFTGAPKPARKPSMGGRVRLDFSH